jgi:hypothetical protein
MKLLILGHAIIVKSVDTVSEKQNRKGDIGRLTAGQGGLGGGQE